MAGGSRDRGMYVWRGQCVRRKDVAEGRNDRGMYSGGSV